jgi:hypothetical protein
VEGRRQMKEEVGKLQQRERGLEARMKVGAMLQSI